MSTERYMRRAVCGWLFSQNLTPVFEVYMGSHTCDFVGAEFAERTGRRIPSLLKTVAVELKLEDVADVLRQCRMCRYKVHAAYAAMPAERCLKMTDATIAKFMDAGVGLLAVGRSVNVALAALDNPPNLQGFWKDSFQRKLWRRRDEWQPRLEKWEQSQRVSTT